MTIEKRRELIQYPSASIFTIAEDLKLRQLIMQVL
jgi:hypothetical protein